MPEFEVKVLDTDFGSDVTVSLLVKVGNAENLKKKMIDITNGRLQYVQDDEVFENFA